MPRALLLISLALLAPLSLADSLPDLSRVWFKPVLEESHQPICQEFRDSAEAHFLSRQQGWQAFKPASLQPLPVDQTNIRLADGSEVHFNRATHPGCGGACESYQILASRTPMAPHSATKQQLAAAAPPSTAPRLLRDNTGQVFVLSEGNWQRPDMLLLHRLDSDLSWSLACSVRTAPASTEQVAEEARQAVAALESAAGMMSRGYGDCGSARTGDRWRSTLHEQLQTSLYRPWALYETIPENNYPDYGLYDQDQLNLQRWALTGVLEYQALQHYQAQLQKTTTILTRFYRQHLGWPEAQAEGIANTALKAAISSGIRFYMYEPFAKEETTLRRAILEQRPLAEIRRIEGSLSDLSIAVLYPEALNYLLEQGADPNQRNPFGKTALMYATQYNQLESARLLLAKGAGPNATTIWPEDRCTYQLSTSNMTALHYAARYAAPELIDLLLQKGAAPFIQSISTAYKDGRTGAPLDWLKRHTALDAKEANPHIPAARIAALEQALRIPPPEQLQQRARQLTLQAEKDYAEGRSLPAYRALLLAREAAPQDARILSNLSLVAFKLGGHGPALEAGQQLLDSSQDAKLLANAWFNQGLVCDAAGRTFYNDKYYCRSGSLYPYFRAAALGATPARQARLLERLNSGPQKRCTAVYGEGQVHIVLQSDGRRSEHGYVVLTLYVLHPSAIQLKAEDFTWQLESQRITPYAAATLALGEWTLSVLESPEYMSEKSFQVAGQACALRQDGRE